MRPDFDKAVLRIGHKYWEPDLARSQRTVSSGLSKERINGGSRYPVLRRDRTWRLALVEHALPALAANQRDKPDLGFLLPWLRTGMMEIDVRYLDMRIAATKRREKYEPAGKMGLKSRRAHSSA